MNAGRPTGFLRALGPGLLFAAAAVGVSHLVQSTRAGAGYGVALIGFVLIANLLKYPAFRFGPEYAAATGTSLLQGYRRQGRWALVLYALLTISTMFTVQAAVTVVTAGLLMATLGFKASPVLISAGLLAACAALLVVGRYRWLDRVTKLLVLVLAVSTITATALAAPHVDLAGPWLPKRYDAKTVAFIAALVGWMPSAIDVAVWHSLWTLARGADSGHQPTMRESRLDFHIGYVGTAVLALCFLLMGAGVMHAKGVSFSPSAAGFAAQLISLYSGTLGAWTKPIVGIAATAVMFSTTLAVLDGFPRALAVLSRRFHTDEQPHSSEVQRVARSTPYWISMAVVAGGSLVVLAVFLKSLKTMVDVATTASFLTAPLLATLNHRAILQVDSDKRPGAAVLALSVLSIIVLGAFACFYVYTRYS